MKKLKDLQVLSNAQLTKVDGAATTSTTLSPLPAPSIDWTRTNYGFVLGVDTRDCD